MEKANSLTLQKKPLKKISKKGHHVVIATGRPYRMAKDFYDQLELETPMINFNGSLTHLLVGLGNMKNVLLWTKKYLFGYRKTKKRISRQTLSQVNTVKKFYITSPDKEICRS